MFLRRIVNKCVDTPDLLKHYKIRVNRTLTEAKRTKCTWSAEEMRFYAKVLNSSKHTVMRKNTIKDQEIVSENRVENAICLNQTSILSIFLEIALGGSLLTRFWGHQSSTLRPQEGPEGSQGPPRALRRSQKLPGAPREAPVSHQEAARRAPRSFRWPPWGSQEAREDPKDSQKLRKRPHKRPKDSLKP